MSKKLTKCIGIISYLPQVDNIRAERFNKLIKTIDKLNKLFNLPIYIIAQNYSDSELEQIKKNNVFIKSFNKGLGIAHAREELRKLFLSTKYDVIILLDDDADIAGDDATEYLRQIDINPGKLGLMDGMHHKLMSVPRSVYEKVGYDLVNSPENLLGYEDSIFAWKVIGRDFSNRFIFKYTGLEDKSIQDYDYKTSSWAANLTKEQRDKIRINTAKIVYELTGFKTMEIKRD